MAGHTASGPLMAAVVIPYRPSSPSRHKAFQHVSAQTRAVGEALGIPVIVHDSGDEPFSIARTWNALSVMADQALGAEWEHLISWGADFVLQDPVAQITAALEHPAHFVYANDSSSRQTRQEALAGVIEYRDGPAAFGPNVTTRERWETVGSFDERFVGYGGEDYARAHGSRLLGFPFTRITGRQLILWHESAKRARARKNDPYMERREPNLKLFRTMIEPISTPEEWAYYLEHRYDHGRDNPFHPMPDDERKKWW